MTANTMGIIIGLVAGLIITAILITIFNKDGKLCAALFLIMAIELIIKKIMDGKTGE